MILLVTKPKLQGRKIQSAVSTGLQMSPGYLCAMVAPSPPSAMEQYFRGNLLNFIILYSPCGQLRKVDLTVWKVRSG